MNSSDVTSSVMLAVVWGGVAHLVSTSEGFSTMEDCGVMGGVSILMIWESFLLRGGGLFGGGGLGFG